MKNVNKIKILITLLLIVGTIFTLIILNKNQNKLTTNTIDTPDKTSIAVILCDENNENCESGGSNIPSWGYVLDEEKSYCTNGGEIDGYANGIVTYSLLGTSQCYLYFYAVEITGAETITALASETGAGATDGHPGGMVSDEYGIRYIGENPSNFVWFNCSDLTNQNASTCERWRIIGVFDEKYDTDDDNIPDTIGPLIKIIRNDSLGDYYWDYKQNGVGSSTIDYGSNDWSDSQLMMMLNPPEFLNSGYVTEEGAATHSNTISGEYVVSNGINIYRNMGSYFDEGLTAYSPAQTTTSGFTSTTQPGATFTRMSTLSQSMIATVKWHLTGPNGVNFTSSSNGLASHWYAYERNDPDGTGYVYTGAGTRPKIWYGKVGLMYASDYGFATSGDASVSGYDRASCLNEALYNWDDESYQTYCAYKDWLLYAGATGGTSTTKGSASNYQWTMIPRSSNVSYVYIVTYDGHLAGDNAYCAYVARPVLYLKAGVSITEGDGTYDSPYKLSQ